MSAKGFFISFEGGEGAGKTTQINRLAQHLKRRKYDVVITREPGGTPGAEAIRHLLLSGEAEKYGPLAEAALFAVARADHVNQIIRPALEQGKIVLCDRFYDSTHVYQGIGGKVPEAYLDLLDKVSIGHTVPQLTFILDLPAKIGMARASKRRGQHDAIDRFEKDKIETQEERRQAFLAIAKAHPKRCRIIDATESEFTTSIKICRISDETIRGVSDGAD